MPHLLILDDDKAIRETLADIAGDSGYSVAQAASVKEALLQLDMRPPELVLADLFVPGGDGLEVCRNATAVGSEVVVMTGCGSVDNAVQALRMGVRDYLIKPVCLERLQSILSSVARENQVASIGDGHCGRMIGESVAMRDLYLQLKRVAATDLSVLLVGESGTGKELAAEAVHQMSPRHKASFIAVNCGAIAPNLIESEMFGHERGSFTGADRQHKGYFERADGGTLFLDEITEMPMDLQVKLLRVLETGQFMRVGNPKGAECDVRVIAATNRSPEQAVREGRLREDLYYRLAVFPIELPPLRARDGDALLLAEAFLAGLNQDHGRGKAFAPEIQEQLEEYHWPGNVRELRNYVSRAFVMADGDTLTLRVSSGLETDGGMVESPLLAQMGTVTVPVGLTLAEADRRFILATLDQCRGVKKLAASVLGVCPKTLYNRLESYAAQEQQLPSERQLGSGQGPAARGAPS